ncbi:MAG: flagellar hook-length control protein FliK [Stenotrophomonas nitritireducens]|uniref:flagellar hook-length control protein FliK n=1 Tax=Stenotrophomonas nitritireducens TaxID=83617 RepID=UPI001AC9F616|nr:flagellar hook-length control protein FliK [Stenotrophomonas nitritireducens]MBN8768912.1 flagellar hook-length control protein FliK [Stenotrophomonas sp.]MBN8792950.1 flagellar hook-length control protein FliK [Stenotrophomonas nitritireducens]
MTPLSLGAGAPASQTAGTGGPAPGGNGAGKQSGGFDTLLQASPQPAPRAKSGAKPSPEPQGQRRDDSTAASPRPADAPDTAGESTASGAAKPAPPAAADSRQDEADPGDLPWPPPGLSGLLPVAAPAPAAVGPAPPVADASGDPPAPAVSLPGAPLPIAAAIPQASAAAPAAAAPELAADAMAQLATLETVALPRSGIENSLPATDPSAGAALFGPLLQNLAAVADARPAAPFPPALAAPVDMQAADLDEAIGARVGWLADQKIGHAHIRVTPNDLGPVEVKLQLDGDRIHATFSSSHAEVRQALENGLPRLREMLGEQGLQLAQADVGHRQSDSGSSSGTAAANAGVDADDDASMPATDVRTLQLRGLLDAYA